MYRSVLVLRIGWVRTWLPPSAGFASGKFEGQFRVHDDLTSDLRNGLVDSAAPFDAIGRRNAAPEKFGDSPDAVNMFFRRSNDIGLPLRLLAVVLLEGMERCK